jgi:hypothetical protein
MHSPIGIGNSGFNVVFLEVEGGVQTVWVNEPTKVRWGIGYICLVCGHTELMVPPAGLKQLRKGAAVFDSQGHTYLNSSICA